MSCQHQANGGLCRFGPSPDLGQILPKAEVLLGIFSHPRKIRKLKAFRAHPILGTGAYRLVEISLLLICRLITFARNSSLEGRFQLLRPWSVWIKLVSHRDPHLAFLKFKFSAHLNRLEQSQSRWTSWAIWQFHRRVVVVVVIQLFFPFKRGNVTPQDFKPQATKTD